MRLVMQTVAQKGDVSIKIWCLVKKDWHSCERGIQYGCRESQCVKGFTMPTIREVAEKSGVCASTVSRVLAGGSDRARYSARVVQQVEATALSLGYRVNYHMRSVRKRRSDAIGFIIECDPQTQGHQAGDWYFEQMLEGVQAAAQAAGCAVMQVRSTDREVEEKSALQRGLHFVQERRLDGLVLPGMLTAFHGRMDNPAYDAVPVVVVEPREPTRWCSVGFDDAAGIRMILNHLVEWGHRRLLWLGPASTTGYTPDSREQLLLHAAFALEVTGDSCYYPIEHDIRLETFTQRVEAALLKHLAGHPKPFTAIVAYNDLAATIACRVLASQGIGVPGQVSVTGFDDSYAVLASPPLTTVTHELFEMGLRAGRLVLEMIGTDEAKRIDLRRHREVITPRFIQRQSTGPVAR